MVKIVLQLGMLCIATSVCLTVQRYVAQQRYVVQGVIPSAQVAVIFDNLKGEFYLQNMPRVNRGAQEQ